MPFSTIAGIIAFSLAILAAIGLWQWDIWRDRRLSKAALRDMQMRRIFWDRDADRADHDGVDAADR